MKHQKRRGFTQLARRSRRVIIISILALVIAGGFITWYSVNTNQRIDQSNKETASLKKGNG